MAASSVSVGAVVRSAVCIGSIAALMTVVLPADAFAETMGDHLWNLRVNTQDFFHDNDSWIRPWRTGVDDGWGSFEGGHTFDFGWGPTGTTGNPTDGSLSVNRGVDTQFHVWTYLYASSPTIVSLTGDGDCVPRWFLNYQFDSPQQFPLGAPAGIGLSAGWNRLDITGYNQNAGFLFESSALVGQVAIMNTTIIPEPSAICALISLLATGGLLHQIRRRAARRFRGRLRQEE